MQKETSPSGNRTVGFLLLNLQLDFFFLKSVKILVRLLSFISKNFVSVPIRFLWLFHENATSGPVSTWMGDRLGTPGAVGFLLSNLQLEFFFEKCQNTC